ncbi:MAG: hypothetical protein SGPRY_003902 [Prymnesium sp.]
MRKAAADMTAKRSPARAPDMPYVGEGLLLLSDAPWTAVILGSSFPGPYEMRHMPNMETITVATL